MLDLARLVCASASSDEAWTRLLANADRLFWSNDEALPDTWARLFGSAVGGADVEEHWHGQQLRYRYRGRGKVVPLRFGPDDPLILIHALARLVRRDVEFRLCTASRESSDTAFLAMAPADWATLETSIGRSAVGVGFCRLAAGFDAFLRQAFPASAGASGSFAPQITVWKGVTSYCQSRLDYVIVIDGPGQVRHEALAQLIRRYLAAGPVDVCVGASDEQRRLDRDALAEAIAECAGVSDMRIVDATRAGFLVIEVNGVAAGWRTDAGLPEGETWLASP